MIQPVTCQQTLKLTKGIIMNKLLTSIVLGSVIFFTGCIESNADYSQKTKSGVQKAEATVKTQASGMTFEQENIVRSYEVENKPGAIKHLYVISPYSGQVLIYSTVKGKVTSSQKSINPTIVVGTEGQSVGRSSMGFPVTVHGQTKYTPQVMQESGTYGSSDPYIFWWDVAGRYHKHFVTGGQILHISDQPMPVKDVVINMEITTK